MSDAASIGDTVRVTRCETEETLAAASALFNQYRHHYSQPSDADARTLGWLVEMVESKMLTVHTAFVDSRVEAPPVGLATAHPIPASLVLGHSWQLRDLYVLPGSRGHGVGGALVGAVRENALEAGAIRLSLVTEPDNAAALDLYRRLGFRPVEGLLGLSLDLGPQDVRE
jgi:GNAT superfamily N-acetyltransferase